MTHRSLNVVIASPDDAFRAWLAYALENRGMSVRVTSSGGQALAWAGEGLANLFFVSAILPDVLGFEVIERLRAAPFPSSPRVVLIGAIFRAYRYHAAPRTLYGADAYIEEGIVEEELDSVLETLLGKRPPSGQKISEEEKPVAPADAVEEARTLARIIISDIYIYQPIRARRAILKERFEEAFADDLKMGREYFEKRFPMETLGGRDVFRENLEEFLSVTKKEHERKPSP